MSNIVVITFDNMEEAEKVRQAVKGIQSKDLISLDDAAVIVKDEDGKVKVHDEMDRGVKTGIVGGGVLGVLLSFMFGGPFLAFPVAMGLIGAAGGAAVGALTDMGIQKSFVKDVTESLQPGGSALFLIVRGSNPAAAIAVLKPYKGTVIHTSLPPEAEETLTHVLKNRTE